MDDHPGWLSKAGAGLFNNVRDAMALGLWFPLRHLSDGLGRPRYYTQVNGAGRVALRAKSSDAAVFRQVFRSREYNLGRFVQHTRVLAAIEHAVAAGRTPVIIDAGANVGASALYFSATYPQAMVVAIEPDPANAELCELNTAGRRNIIVVRAAVGSEPGHADLLGTDGEAWAIQTSRSDDGPVPILTIDQAIAAIPNGAPIIIKIDIEGFESDVFSANTGWIDRSTAVIIEPHDWLFPEAATSRSLQRAMAGRDFDLMLSGENLVYIRRDANAQG